MAALQAANSVASQSAHQVTGCSDLGVLAGVHVLVHHSRIMCPCPLGPCSLQQHSPRPARPHSAGRPATTAARVSSSNTPCIILRIICWCRPSVS